ncbi:glycine zipper 2TM domain-containing protein [Pseudoxanthomonas beigongshangi]
MNRLSTALLAFGLLASSAASAQSHAGGYGDRDERYASGDYDYARVIRVDPIIENNRYGARTVGTAQRCYYRDADDQYVSDDGYYGDDRYREDRYGDRYGDDRYRGNETGRTVATVIGGIAGAVLGSKIGDGSGRYVGTAVGSMVGGMAGRSIYDNTQRNRQVRRGTVRVCDPEPVNGGYNGYDGDGRVSGYDVTYEYANRTYHTRTSYHPGDRIRVRVDVRPE